MAHLHNIYDSDIHFKLDYKTRLFTNETELKLLVAQGDHNSERITFEIPRYIEQHDMLKCNRIEIHYINISSTTRDASKDVYIVDDAQVSPEDENVVEFSWLLSGRATQYNGTLSFAISMKCLTDEVIDYRWNTLTYDKILVGKSLNNAETIAQEYSDVLEKWKKEVLENINPTVTIDTDLNEKSDNAIANCTVAKKISQLSDEIANVGNPTDEQVASAVNTYIEENGISAGLTENQIIALNEMFKVCAYTQSDVSTQYNAFKTAFGIGGNEEPEEPDTPITPTVTLTSISATYSGVEVLVGTDVDDLTGITVTGAYSDGTTKNIIDYTLSGTINEGTNTITISYQGKSTTFTVVGYVDEEEPSGTTEAVYKLAQATTLDGTSGIDSGYILNDVDKDFSILVEYEPTSNGGYIFDATKNANLFGPYLKNDGNNNVKIGNANNTCTYVGNKVKTKFIMTHKKGSDTFDTFLINSNINYISTQQITCDNYGSGQHTVGNTNTLKIGTKYTNDTSYFNGTIYRFEIYERIITSEEVEVFMNPTWFEPTEPINLIDLSTCTLGATMNDGRKISEDYYVTDYIPIAYGNPYITNITNYIDETNTVTNYMYFYTSSKSYKGVSQFGTANSMGTTHDLTSMIMNVTDTEYVRLIFHKNYKDIAFFGEGLV